MKLHVAREKFTSRSTVGSLYLDGKFFCYTLEPPKTPDPAAMPTIVCIPPAIYAAHLFESPEWTRKCGYPFLVIAVDGVPGRSGIEFHIGNRPPDTRGCCLVGLSKAADWVGSSEDAFYRLMHRIIGDIYDPSHGPLTVEYTEPEQSPAP